MFLFIHPALVKDGMRLTKSYLKQFNINYIINIMLSNKII